MNYCNNNNNDNNNNEYKQLMIIIIITTIITIIIIIIMIIKISKVNSYYKLFQFEFEMLPIDDISISFYILRFPIKSSKVWNFFIIF